MLTRRFVVLGLAAIPAILSAGRDLAALPAPDTLDLLRSRRSGSAKAMGKPGPSKTQLAEIIQSGARAPDHGKLFPWRFIIFEGKGRERFGDVLAEVLEAEGERPKQIEEERVRSYKGERAECA